MWGFLVALISGALMSIQGVFNTEMTKQTSLWVSTAGYSFLRFWSVCWRGFLPGGIVLARCGRWRINILYLAVLSEHLLP